MNYKVILSWLAAGAFAYNAGIHANMGTVIFSAVMAISFLFVGLMYMETPNDKRYEKWEDAEEYVPEKKEEPYFAPQQLPPDYRPTKTVVKIVKARRTRRGYTFRRNDTVRLVKANSHREESHLGELFKVLGRNTPVTWQIENPIGEKLFVFDDQLEFVSRYTNQSKKEKKTATPRRRNRIVYRIVPGHKVMIMGTENRGDRPRLIGKVSQVEEVREVENKYKFKVLGAWCKVRKIKERRPYQTKKRIAEKQQDEIIIAN